MAKRQWCPNLARTGLRQRSLSMSSDESRAGRSEPSGRSEQANPAGEWDQAGQSDQPDQGGSGGQPASREAWQEVGREFEALGASLAAALRSARQRSDTADRTEGLQHGLRAMMDQLRQAVD